MNVQGRLQVTHPDQEQLTLTLGEFLSVDLARFDESPSRAVLKKQRTAIRSNSELANTFTLSVPFFSPKFETDRQTGNRCQHTVDYGAEAMRSRLRAIGWKWWTRIISIHENLCTRHDPLKAIPPLWQHAVCITAQFHRNLEVLQRKWSGQTEWVTPFASKNAQKTSIIHGDGPQCLIAAHAVCRQRVADVQPKSSCLSRWSKIFQYQSLEELRMTHNIHHAIAFV